MASVNIQTHSATARLRAGVGLAGMFVVACFGAALFFTGERSQAAENMAANESTVLIAQSADTQ